MDRQIDFGCMKHGLSAIQIIDGPRDGATASLNAHTTPYITISDALTRQQWPNSSLKTESSNKHL